MVSNISLSNFELAFNILNDLYVKHKGDDDDDASFVRWMRSFWSHSWKDEDESLLCQ
jgi:hypothetical protein